MESNHKKWILLILLPLIAGMWFFLWYFQTNWGYEVVESENGVWDLRDFDFTRECAWLTGDVEFVPGQLLTPTEFSASNQVQIGQPGREIQISTSRMRILVPKDRRYMIEGSSIDYADRIYINGEWMQDVGTPGYTRETSSPDSAYLYYTINAADGAVEIVQQTSNFVHWESSPHAEIGFGHPGEIQERVARKTALSSGVMGCFLALFIAHLMLYLIVRSYRANLWFALFCLVWFIRSGLVSPHIFSSILPNLSWFLTIRAEYITIPLACILLALTLRELFPHVIERWFQMAVVAVSGAFAAIYLFADTFIMSQVMLLNQIFIVAVIVTLLILLIRKVRHLNTEQGITCVGIAVFLYAAICSIFYFIDIVIAPLFALPSAEVALLVFVFCQTGAMFIGTMRTVKQNMQKEDFLGSLSHELQMPITVISGFAQISGEILSDETPDMDMLQDNMQQIIRESDRMERMVTQLLDITAIDSGLFTLHPSPMDIGALIEQVASTHFFTLNDNGNELALDIQPGIPTVQADRERIYQVLLNLVSNAAKHTHNGHIAIESYTKHNEIMTTVSDNGEGISPDLLPHLFDRYPPQRSRLGVGLGLFICKSIITSHGGTISIKSHLNKGTAVTFSIPIKDEV